jgi:hypothetical protein
MATQVPQPVHVVAVGVTRHPIEVESAVYFTCVEAVQNALTHGHGATGVWIRLGQTPHRLAFEVRDDGRASRSTVATDAGCTTCTTASKPSAAGSRSRRTPGVGHGSRAPYRCPDSEARVQRMSTYCTSTASLP